jgi:hypothetical protein
MSHPISPVASPRIEIAARIPGPWRSLSELQRRLPRGCRIRRNQLHLADGRRFDFSVARCDREFPVIFETACRREGGERSREQLRLYRMNAELVAQGGSVAGCQQMLEAVAVLLRAGGVGVFIDNGLVAHWRAEWLELAEHGDDPQARMYAYVNIVNGGTEIFSCGLHVLGERDGVIVCPDDSLDGLATLGDFVRMSCEPHPPLSDGATFFDERGGRYSLIGEQHQLPFTNHPLLNPFGRWRLRPS